MGWYGWAREFWRSKGNSSQCWALGCSHRPMHHVCERVSLMNPLLPAHADDPRIRMLNRLYAKKRKELQQRRQQLQQQAQAHQEQQQQQEAAAAEVAAAVAQAAAQVKDDRPIDELLSFIEAEGDK